MDRLANFEDIVRIGCIDYVNLVTLRYKCAPENRSDNEDDRDVKDDDAGAVVGKYVGQRLLCEDEETEALALTKNVGLHVAYEVLLVWCRRIAIERYHLPVGIREHIRLPRLQLAEELKCVADIVICLVSGLDRS